MASHFVFNTIVKDKGRAAFGSNNVVHMNSSGCKKTEDEIVVTEPTQEQNDCESTPIAQETGEGEYDDFVYEMRKGFVMVFHNDHYLEVVSLRDFFEERLNFTFRCGDNVTAKDMLKNAKDVSEKDFTKYDSFFCIILSRENENEVKVVDKSTIPIDAITDLFTAGACPTLRNKPKVFVIDSHHGSKVDMGATESDLTTARLVQKSPTESDFLIAHASSPGYSSYRNEEDGSLFIQELSEVFKHNYEKEHLLDLLLLVNHRVSKRHAIKEQDKGAKQDKEMTMCKVKQMPSQENHLTKKCYFYSQ